MAEKDEAAKNLLAVLGIPVLFLLIVIMFLPLGILNAWVAQKLYIWFALPLGAPHLNLWHVWGLSILINHYTTNYSSNDNKKLGVGILARLIGVMLALLLGYILKGHIGY